MANRRSLRGPVILFITSLVIIITLTVLWNVILVRYYLDVQALSQPGDAGGAFHWTFISVGSTLFTLVIIASSVLGAQLIGQIRHARRQSNFIASVSHELNSPLSAIKLSAQTLRSESLDPDNRQRFVRRILTEVDRLTRLIGNILRAAEADNRSDPLQVITEGVNLSTWLDTYVEEARQLQTGSHGPPLAIEWAGAPNCQVALDPILFRQVLDNLVDNAVRYRGDQPARVRFELHQGPEEVELRVTDAGVGLPVGEEKRIFERFYRVDRLKQHHHAKGTGIGLFVVKGIVEAHSGRVLARSAGPGEGMTVSIHLPRSQEDPIFV